MREQITEAELPPYLAGRYVLVGVNVPGLNDFADWPVHRMTPGIYLHAVAQMLRRKHQRNARPDASPRLNFTLKSRRSLPLRKYGAPEEVAAAVAFAICDLRAKGAACFTQPSSSLTPVSSHTELKRQILQNIMHLTPAANPERCRAARGSHS